MITVHCLNSCFAAKGSFLWHESQANAVHFQASAARGEKCDACQLFGRLHQWRKLGTWSGRFGCLEADWGRAWGGGWRETDPINFSSYPAFFLSSDICQSYQAAYQRIKNVYFCRLIISSTTIQFPLPAITKADRIGQSLLYMLLCDWLIYIIVLFSQVLNKL